MVSDVLRSPIIQELGRVLRAVYGDRERGIVLYGSRARGDASPDSDYDVLIVLDDFGSADRELQRIDEPVSDLCLRHEVVIACQVVKERDYQRAQTPLLMNARREGVQL